MALAFGELGGSLGGSQRIYGDTSRGQRDTWGFCITEPCSQG